MPKRNPPFYGNPNGMQCGQCCYKMMLEHFFPDKRWSFDDMDVLCDAVEGKYTWHFGSIVRLADMGLDIVTYSVFDKEKFIKNPRKYLTQKYSEDVAGDQLENSDMPSVLAATKTYIQAISDNKIKEITAYFTIRDVRALLDDGYLIIAWVNGSMLNNKGGMSGHFILIYDYNDTGVIAHDSDDVVGGKPWNQVAARHIENEVFMKVACPSNAGETSGLSAYRIRRT